MRKQVAGAAEGKKQEFCRHEKYNKYTCESGSHPVAVEERGKEGHFGWGRQKWS